MEQIACLTISGEKNAAEMDPTEDSSQRLLEITMIKLWIQSYKASPIPLLLFDLDLNIIWTNQSFRKVFALPVKKNAWLSLSLPQLNTENLTVEQKRQALKKIVSRENGYSWKGMFVKKGPNAREIKSTLLILPVFSRPGSLMSPVAYWGIVDDLNGLYRTIMHNTFLALLEASKLKDNDTGNHIERVNKYSSALARRLYGKPDYLEIDADFLAEIGFVAALHDVGKIGTPDSILVKNGRLTDNERKIMQEHTINGAYILSSYPSSMARQIALFHHEKWDGTGYPYSLCELLIPLSARIVAIADVYDALRMKRVYKPAFSHQDALATMLSERGKHFDPRLLDEFFAIEKDIEAIYVKLTDA